MLKEYTLKFIKIVIVTSLQVVMEFCRFHISIEISSLFNAKLNKIMEGREGGRL